MKVPPASPRLAPRGRRQGVSSGRTQPATSKKMFGMETRKLKKDRSAIALPLLKGLNHYINNFLGSVFNIHGRWFKISMMSGL